jgi:hypothetical protein
VFELFWSRTGMELSNLSDENILFFKVFHPLIV